MRRSVMAAAAVSLGLVACGTSRTVPVSSNPQVVKDEKAAQVIVQRCVSKGNLLTHDGRRSVLRCMAPPGQEAAMERCGGQAFAKDGVITRRQRANFYQALAVCVEAHR